MTKPRNTKKRTTKQMSADERFTSWDKGECPYCNATTILKHTRDNKEGVHKGLHFSCMNCKAENFFSNDRILNKGEGK